MVFVKPSNFQWIFYIQFLFLIIAVTFPSNIGGLMTTMNGKGYIHNVFPKASISWSTEILIMEFKTKELDVVLFYSGDMNEQTSVSTFKSTLIYIDNNGHLAYNFTRSDEKTKKIIDIKLRNKYGGVFNDNQWHKLKFIRILNKGSNGYELKVSIEEDDISIYQKSFQASTMFVKTRFLSIGGVSNKFIEKKNFIGCFFKVIYKADNVQLDVLHLTQKKLHGFSEIGHPLIFSKTCQINANDFRSISFLSTKSFIVLKTKYEQYKIYDLYIEFKPQIASFLLYFHRSNNNENFVSVEVRNFQVVVGIGFLMKTTMWYPLECTINLGQTYNFNLYVDYINGFSKLKFNEIYVEKHIPSGMTDFSHDLSVFFNSEIIVGGDQFSKNSIKYFPASVWMASLRNGFKGCLEKVILNEEMFDLKRSLSSIRFDTSNDTVEGCLTMYGYQGDCNKASFCKNNAHCESNWPNTSCNCDFTNYDGQICNRARKPINFDGSEFIRLDLGTEFYTEVEHIFIRFKTSYQYTYVFSMDPFDSSEFNHSSAILSIENGSPKFEFQPKDERQIFKLSTNVSDGKWHTLIIARNYRTLSLNLDGRVLQQAIHSNETILSWQQINVAATLKPTDLHYSRPFSPKIWLIKTNSDQSRDLKQNFVGQIIKFVINGIDIIKDYLLVKHEPQDVWKMQTNARLNTNQNKIVYPLTFLTHQAYLKFSKLHLYDSFSLFFYLKTGQPSGVLLMVSGSSNDFILLELYKSDIKLSFNMGSSVQAFTSNCEGSCNLADNKWHSVEISRQDLSRNVLSLMIDEKIVEEITIFNSHKAKNFNLDKPAYLGGLPSHEYNIWQQNINFHFGFQGCIAGFSINSRKPINLLQHSSVEIPEEFKHQINHGCQSNSNVCNENYCKNGGQCLQQFNKASCDCSYTTFDGEYCSLVSSTINFGRQVASYNYINIVYQDRTRNTSKDDIAFGLQTKKQEGTIMFIESKKRDKGDFMHLYLENGKLVFEYDMGAGILKLMDHSTLVSDGFYRRIRVRRVGASAWLQIDNARSELEPKKMSLGRSFNEQSSIWIGAMPNKREAKQFEGSLSGLIFNGIRATQALEKKKEFPYLQISSVGDIYLNLSAKIKLPKNSNFEITDLGTKKIYVNLESSISPQSNCNNWKNNQCITTKSKDLLNFKTKSTSPISVIQLSEIPVLSTKNENNNTIASSIVNKRTLIIVFTCFIIVFVIVSFCVICRCCRKRGDRGSYNLTKADKYEQRTPMFDPRPDLQSSTSVQSISPEKDMIEMSPLSKNSKIIETSPCRLSNGILLNSGGSTQTIATYIPKNKEQTRKKKEIKEWYV